MIENKRIILYVCLISLKLLFIECSNIVKEKPDWFQTCRINDPGYVKCSTESVQKMMTHVIKGDVPEITAKIGSLDPMKLDEVKFKQGNSQAVSLKMEVYNLMLTGLSELKINESRVNKKDCNWRTKMYLPKLHLEGDYKTNGKVLLLPLNGNGKFVMDIDRLNILMRTKSRLYEKEGFIFSNVTKVNVDLDCGRVHVNFENLFNGSNKEIEQGTNDLFNSNWHEFFEALRPIVTETVEHILLKIMKESFDILPSNFLIEDIETPAKLCGINSTA